MSRIEFLEASRFLWGVSVEQKQKRKLHRFSTWETLARPAHRSSHNKAMDAESTFNARETVLTDVTFRAISVITSERWPLRAEKGEKRVILTVRNTKNTNRLM